MFFYVCMCVCVCLSFYLFFQNFIKWFLDHVCPYSNFPQTHPFPICPTVCGPNLFMDTWPTTEALLKKMYSLSPSSSQLVVRRHSQLPYMLQFSRLAWAWTGLAYAVITIPDPHKQLLCCVWKTLCPCVHEVLAILLPPLLQRSLTLGGAMQ